MKPQQTLKDKIKNFCHRPAKRSAILSKLKKNIESLKLSHHEVAQLNKSINTESLPDSERTKRKRIIKEWMFKSKNRVDKFEIIHDRMKEHVKLHTRELQNGANDLLDFALHSLNALLDPYFGLQKIHARYLIDFIVELGFFASKTTDIKKPDARVMAEHHFTVQALVEGFKVLSHALLSAELLLKSSATEYLAINRSVDAIFKSVPAVNKTMLLSFKAAMPSDNLPLVGSWANVTGDPSVLLIDGIKNAVTKFQNENPSEELIKYSQVFLQGLENDLATNRYDLMATLVQKTTVLISLLIKSRKSPRDSKIVNCLVHNKMTYLVDDAVKDLISETLFVIANFTIRMGFQNQWINELCKMTYGFDREFSRSIFDAVLENLEKHQHGLNDLDTDLLAKIEEEASLDDWSIHDKITPAATRFITEVLQCGQSSNMSIIDVFNGFERAQLDGMNSVDHRKQVYNIAESVGYTSSKKNDALLKKVTNLVDGWFQGMRVVQPNSKTKILTNKDEQNASALTIQRVFRAWNEENKSLGRRAELLKKQDLVMQSVILRMYNRDVQKGKKTALVHCFSHKSMHDFKKKLHEKLKKFLKECDFNKTLDEWIQKYGARDIYSMICDLHYHLNDSTDKPLIIKIQYYILSEMKKNRILFKSLYNTKQEVACETRNLTGMISETFLSITNEPAVDASEQIQNTSESNREMLKQLDRLQQENTALKEQLNNKVPLRANPQREESKKYPLLINAVIALMILVGAMCIHYLGITKLSILIPMLATTFCATCFGAQKFGDQSVKVALFPILGFGLLSALTFATSIWLPWFFNAIQVLYFMDYVWAASVCLMACSGFSFGRALAIRPDQSQKKSSAQLLSNLNSTLSSLDLVENQEDKKTSKEGIERKVSTKLSVSLGCLPLEV